MLAKRKQRRAKRKRRRTLRLNAHDSERMKVKWSADANERNRKLKEQGFCAKSVIKGTVKVTAKRIYLNQSPWLKCFLNGTKIILTFFLKHLKG